MAERRTGAGSRLSGVLERSTPLSPSAEPDEPESSALPIEASAEAPDAGEPAGAGKGGPIAGPAGKKVGKKKGGVRGRTIYLPDALFERILVQAHRKDVTISDYVAALLERHVPDYRGGARPRAAEGDAA